MHPQPIYITVKKIISKRKTHGAKDMINKKLLIRHNTGNTQSEMISATTPLKIITEKWPNNNVTANATFTEEEKKIATLPSILS